MEWFTGSTECCSVISGTPGKHTRQTERWPCAISHKIPCSVRERPRREATCRTRAWTDCVCCFVIRLPHAAAAWTNQNALFVTLPPPRPVRACLRFLSLFFLTSGRCSTRHWYCFRSVNVCGLVVVSGC